MPVEQPPSSGADTPPAVKADTQPERMFSQTELDDIVRRRVAQERRKFEAQLAQVAEQAARLAATKSRETHDGELAEVLGLFDLTADDIQRRRRLKRAEEKSVRETQERRRQEKERREAGYPTKRTPMARFSAYRKD